MLCFLPNIVRILEALLGVLGLAVASDDNRFLLLDPFPSSGVSIVRCSSHAAGSWKISTFFAWRDPKMLRDQRPFLSCEDSMFPQSEGNAIWNDVLEPCR